jgi:hypothetical protein
MRGEEMGWDERHVPEAADGFKSSQVSQVKSDQVKSGRVKPSQVESRQVKPCLPEVADGLVNDGGHSYRRHVHDRLERVVGRTLREEV